MHHMSGIQIGRGRRHTLVSVTKLEQINSRVCTCIKRNILYISIHHHDEGDVGAAARVCKLRTN